MYRISSTHPTPSALRSNLDDRRSGCSPGLKSGEKSIYDTAHSTDAVRMPLRGHCAQLTPEPALSRVAFYHRHSALFRRRRYSEQIGGPLLHLLRRRHWPKANLTCKSRPASAASSFGRRVSLCCRWRSILAQPQTRGIFDRLHHNADATAMPDQT
jgi:hypothetical protein